MLQLAMSSSIAVGTDIHFEDIRQISVSETLREPGGNIEWAITKCITVA